MRGICREGAYRTPWRAAIDLLLGRWTFQLGRDHRNSDQRGYGTGEDDDANDGLSLGSPYRRRGASFLVLNVQCARAVEAAADTITPRRAIGAGVPTEGESSIGRRRGIGWGRRYMADQRAGNGRIAKQERTMNWRRERGFFGARRRLGGRAALVVHRRRARFHGLSCGG